MAVYPRSVELDRGADRAFALTHDGFVTLFHSRELLAEELRWLRDANYRVIELDAAAWATPADLYDEFAVVFSFPDYFGRNHHALRDCLRDVQIHPDATGVVLALHGYDAFARAYPDDANFLLDILETQAREQKMFGERWLVLVQSDDPRLSLEPIGAYVPRWNHREFRDSSRGL
jgi:methionine synthase II (cobalamin-independent)